MMMGRRRQQQQQHNRTNFNNKFQRQRQRQRQRKQQQQQQQQGAKCSCFSPSLVLMVTLLSFVISKIDAFPIFLVDSPRVKCTTIEAPMDTILKVEYKAPDLIIDKTDPNYGPAYLSVNVSPSKRVLDMENHPSLISKRLNPTSELLKTTEGWIKHRMEVDGEAKICFRASMASETSPMRFGLQVNRLEADDDRDFFSGRDTEETDGDGQMNVDGHLSHMELEMKRIGMAMKAVLSDADFSREQDASLHKQTASMHSATIFWPIVQVCVLLMTGFTQASHITRFFQSRRII